MHQYSMACCALALNTEPETSKWLDWIFAEKGGHLPRMLMQLFDRDGMSEEGAPGYCYLWPSKIVSLMEILEPYEPYTRHRITRERRGGSFVRQLSLGQGLDTENIAAHYDRGVLSVTIPVQETAKPRKIAVQAGTPAETIEGKAGGRQRSVEA